MKTYNEFLLEFYSQDGKLWEGTNSLTEKEAIEMIKTKCSHYFNRRKVVLRHATLGDLKYIYNDPSKFERKSKNSANFYTLIINNHPTWEGYPKRKIIAQTNYINNAHRGNNNIYVVVPFNDIKWGVCPEHDMWFSFKDPDDLAFFNMTIKDIAHYLEIEIRDDTLEHFKEDLKKLDLELKTATDVDYSLFSEVVKTFKDSGDIFNYYVENINPNKNGFKIMGSHELYDMAENNPNKEQEVWTDEECLMIQVDEYEKLIK